MGHNKQQQKELLLLVLNPDLYLPSGKFTTGISRFLAENPVRNFFLKTHKHVRCASEITLSEIYASPCAFYFFHFITLCKKVCQKSVSRALSLKKLRNGE